MFLFILIITAWLVIGGWGYIYWTTSKNDFTYSDIPFLCMVSIVGPFSWIAGSVIYGNKNDEILIKKRNSKPSEELLNEDDRK